MTNNKGFAFFLLTCILTNVLLACNSDKPPIAPAVKTRDSIPVMTSYGVSKLISDSGLMRYKVVAEEWSVYDRTSPTKQTFMKGLLLEKFNQKFHIQMFISADTAYWYNQELWELRGRVAVWNENGTRFYSELLFWDMNRHEFYSSKFSHLITPEREVEGFSFHSNEQMTQYEVNIAHAVFPLPENMQQDTASTAQDAPAELPTKESRIVPQKVQDAPSPNMPPGGHFK